MRIRVLLLTAAAAAATLAPASADAAGARLCDDGEIGVVVYDDTGDLVTAASGTTSTRCAGTSGSVIDWVEDEPLPECVTTRRRARSSASGRPFPPLPPIG